MGPEIRIRDYRFGQLLESIVFHWYAVSVADYLAGNYPHFKVMLESDANGDDRLLRGEIMTITDIMTTRLRSKSLGSHIVAPLLVLSLMGPRHVRVQEADLGGEILNMCASRLYDFMQKNTDVTQLLTRYWIGDTCGQTMEVSLIGGAFGLGYCSVVLSGNRNAALGMYDEEFTISWTSVVQETTFET